MSTTHLRKCKHLIDNNQLITFSSQFVLLISKILSQIKLFTIFVITLRESYNQRERQKERGFIENFVFCIDFVINMYFYCCFYFRFNFNIESSSILNKPNDRTIHNGRPNEGMNKRINVFNDDRKIHLLNREPNNINNSCQMVIRRVITIFFSPGEGDFVSIRYVSKFELYF